ncbi:hypothetical protein [Limosilactobacillus allomucosae]|uniref:Uncharacterized protein n=1 Tax=Limosilactobacillus allomucosae TaxID=3142938 RepID=A0AAU7C1S4_9LACO
MNLSPNENALIDETLKEIGATIGSLSHISCNEFSKEEIIERLSMAIASLELAQQPLITVRNKVRERRKE